MKKAFVTVVALALPACTDQYGRTDPGSTALLGAAAGAALGYGVGQTSTRERTVYQPYYGGSPYYGRQYYGGSTYYGRPYYGGQPYYGRQYYSSPAYYGRSYYGDRVWVR